MDGLMRNYLSGLPQKNSVPGTEYSAPTTGQGQIPAPMQNVSVPPVGQPTAGQYGPRVPPPARPPQIPVPQMGYPGPRPRPVWQGFPQQPNPANARARDALSRIFERRQQLPGRMYPVSQPGPQISAPPVAPPVVAAPQVSAPPVAAPVPQVSAPPREPSYLTNPLSTRPRGLLGI